MGDSRIRDDLPLLVWFGARLLVLRSGPEDLPYSPALTWIAIALMASTYPAWMIVLSETPPGSVPPTGGLLLAWAIGPVACLLGACALVLRAFDRASRFNQFAMALSLVHGLTMLAMFGSVLVRVKLTGPEPVEQGWRVAVAWLSALVPLAVTLWYGLAMSHVWARTLDRGYAVGLLMTLLMNAAMWIVPVVLLIGFVEASNLFN
ncbi:hypothetical protein [Silanimonas sp.]|uniref:hypothetical protein n=1 Tax=Silanimonas sp. TaxID=1929290 RepID=UPI0022BFC70D|nr:hypothetical protein [Silanimonas sp.]MCZ8062675.1 hypothetical protein [Silanimonas sp.]